MLSASRRTAIGAPVSLEPSQTHPALLSDSEFCSFQSSFHSAFSHAGELIERFEQTTQRAQLIANLPGGAQSAMELMRAGGSSDGLSFHAQIDEILRALIVPYAACSRSLAPMAERLGLEPSEAELAARQMQAFGMSRLPRRLAEVTRVYFEQAELTLSQSCSSERPVSRPKRAL